MIITFEGLYKLRNYTYVLSLLPAAVAIVGNLAGSWWSLSNLVFSLGILGIVESISGTNTSNKHSHKEHPVPTAILFAHVLWHTALVLSLFYGIQSGILHSYFIVFATISSGIAAGSGSVVIAHELVHKAQPLKQFFGNYLLFLVGNFYFKVHHLRVHHKLVGTAEDAATAQRGEGLYQFYLRTIRQQIAQGWQVEALRLKKQGLSVMGLKNEIIRNVTMQVVILLLLLVSLGITAVVVWILFSLTASFLLEYVNYIEHYGLIRNKAEKVNHTHSWNCDKVISRFFLIDLSRHADHHFHASKSYHMLESHPQSPRLPGGYISMILPALVPFWWFKLVHPILDSAKNSG